MPRGRWTDKDERQYEHIKQSETESGASPREAKEIAARTVNKTRREQGRTENRRTMGTGNPNLPMDARMRDELYNLARELRIPGRSKMTKRDLARALQPVPAARLPHPKAD
jgi:plasmid stabilization system protein ParE